MKPLINLVDLDARLAVIEEGLLLLDSYFHDLPADKSATYITSIREKAASENLSPEVKQYLLNLAERIEFPQGQQPAEPQVW